MRRRTAHLPLHGGKAPAWLFQRMVKLAGAMTMAVVEEFGPNEMLRRLSDPWWFQAFGCVLGFDWHSSGVTTVTCGAMKEAFKEFGDDLGILVAGGKGAVSRKTPREITEVADQRGISQGDRLIYASRMSAKVDSAALQDGFGVYHHSFFFTPEGAWAVVQQGMNEEQRYARRYHWMGETVDDFVCEPHTAIRDLSGVEHTIEPAIPNRQMEFLISEGDSSRDSLLNMVAAEADANRNASAGLIRENPDKLLKLIRDWTDGPTLFAPAHHPVLPADVNLSRLNKIIRSAHERNPKDFETLLGTRNVGPATIRSLALIAELIYDAPVSHRDPARLVSTEDAPISKNRANDQKQWADYSFAHGGKDGFPFPVDRTTYDRNISILTDTIRKARVGETEKAAALKRLAKSRI